MTSLVRSFHKTTLFPHDRTRALRRRLSSLSLGIQPIYSQTSSMGQQVGTSMRNWWHWTCSWVLSRKPIFAQDLEMNEEDTKFLGSHNRGSWRHVLYKLSSQIKRLVRSDNFGLPQTYRNHYSK
ncbi:hypothetical protein K2173_012522 [Erythroxylum novogranatense]|uniref:Uncharacterized protein n=1 Tax=Erythroxylum novogranatense TaxID=1862640 RepID=A0AAV8TM55_9ROSI|nr:hypothetical protein K2173_012522 [Erythroxylum novogranatense]